jgi:hypothetical protein
MFNFFKEQLKTIEFLQYEKELRFKIVLIPVIHNEINKERYLNVFLFERLLLESYSLRLPRNQTIQKDKLKITKDTPKLINLFLIIEHSD